LGCGDGSGRIGDRSTDWRCNGKRVAMGDGTHRQAELRRRLKSILKNVN
jgi:hypothetical protein